eukprot:TRINITY_DN15699_c0_g1_i1.p1 TRINITY_DN15699_c0_g1~~TRINITY_DN15699_c0_g1_i1.p1  ORF type:complete len:158 (-),score=47.46 TRINITY_DN15699_c0_g1_i1:245-718(-)
MCIRDRYQRRVRGVSVGTMQSVISPVRPERSEPQLAPIDRAEVCPSLLRTFVRTGGHHNPELFSADKQPTEDEVLLHTWPDATLRELCTLLKQYHDPARHWSAKVAFAFVYPDKRGKFVLRPVGRVVAGRRGEDDEKQLRQLGWQPGDLLDIAVFSR